VNLPEVFNHHRMPASSDSAAARVQSRGHSRMQALAFIGKAWLFRARRTLSEIGNGRPRRFKAAAIDETTPILAESRGPLHTSHTPAEFALQAGKIQNLRIAAAHLNGVTIPPGEVFGFWTHVPRPTRSRGFVAGRELREGCIIPSVGGGLCQLSNALYDAALSAGCEIVERHAHSQIVPGSMAAAGRDATVFWNYVDLRFRHGEELHLEVRLSESDLIVRLRAGHALDVSRGGRPSISVAPAREDAAPIGSCETCGVESCFRHIAPGTGPTEGVTAWLVDAWWPEFDSHLSVCRHAGDWLFTPLDSRRLRIGPYRWHSAGFARVRQAPWEVAHRSLVSRRLAAQGAERQRALLRFDEALARRYARAVPAAATHLVISQNLLPFLWRDGVLGGRTFDVLMTRLPLRELEATLDRAARSHSSSRTLADFRADPAFVADESAALAAARRWITPHSAIAALAGPRALQLEWELPRATRRVPMGKEIAFPASTLGRKGAYELREAARQLGLRVQLGGPVIEDAAFWNGIKTTRADDHWLAHAAAIVLPAWVEHQPRRLLLALAAGIPVVATEACGLAGMPGVTTIADGDVPGLVEALAAVVAPSSSMKTTNNDDHLHPTSVRCDNESL
jgi:hypothetical protein